MDLGFLVRRLSGAVFTLFLATIIAASLIHLVPGDAADYIGGEGASEETLQQIREKLGSDRSAVEQYSDWVGGVVTGDFGNSLVSDRPVLDSIKRAFPITATIVLFGALGAIVFGVGLGTLAGFKQGSWVDRIVSGVAALAQAVPPFWLGLVLVTFFALDRGLLPATGYSPISKDGVWEWLRHAALPSLTLGFTMSAELMRQTRAAVADVMQQPYIMSARVKGMSRLRLARCHVLRNASIPIVTVLGLQIGRLLGGAVVVEVVFGLQGLGNLAVNAVTRRDFPVLQAYVFTAALAVVTISFLVDLSYGWLNPKVRARS